MLLLPIVKLYLLCVIHFEDLSGTQYSLVVLKVPLNTNQPTLNSYQSISKMYVALTILNVLVFNFQDVYSQGKVELAMTNVITVG